VRDVRDAVAIRRPARGCGVVVAVRELERTRTVGRHQPELIPLAPEVRAVDDAAVAAPVRSRFPGGFFVVNFAAAAPDAAGAVDVASVRDPQQLFAIWRPGWREIVVVYAVVVAWESAVMVFRDAVDAVGAPHENVKAPLVLRRDERDRLAVGRPAWLDVYRAVRRQGFRLTGREIERPQLLRVAAVRRVHDRPAIGRPVRLKVIARLRCQLLGVLCAEL